MKTKLIAGLVVLALVATAIGVISARNNFGVQSPTGAQQWVRGSCWMNQLTEEQRQKVSQKIQEFRQGQRQKAQEFMQQICDQYNITCPSGPQFVDEDGDGINDNMGPHGWRFGVDLDFRGLAQTSTQEE